MNHWRRKTTKNEVVKQYQSIEWLRIEELGAKVPLEGIKQKTKII